MSRNKVILILCLLVMAYVFTPSYGIWFIVKRNIIAALPYLLALVIIYLVITINVLKNRWKKLDSQLNDENVINFAKMMNITFDVKRMLGPDNLIDLYNKVNFSQKVSLHAKHLLYEAMRRKRLDVPVPGKGSDIDSIIRKSHSAAKAEQKTQNKKNKKRH